MISQARDYIKAIIKETDPTSSRKFKEHKDGFNRDNIPSTLLDRSYFIFLSNTDNIVTNNCIVDDVVRARIELFFKGYRDIQSALDDGIDIGHELKLRLSNPAKFSGNIKDVEVFSVIPEPVGDNDNAIIVVLECNLRMIFSTI